MSRRSIIVLLALLQALSVAAHGQASLTPPRGHHYSFELGIALASASYLDRISERWQLRYGIGIGDDWLFNAVLHAGDHYRHAYGYFPSNPTGFDEEMLLGLLHGVIALRYEQTPYLSYDGGFLAAEYYHGDSEDDDGGVAYSLGGFAAIGLGKERIRFAPRIEAGYMAGCAPEGEFVVRIVPLVVRLDTRH